MNAPLRHGATVVVLPRFDLGQFLAAIEKHRISGLYVAPPIVLALAKHPAVAQYDLSSLEYIVSAAAPLDAGLAAACSRRLGLPPVRQAYGMTELSPGTHVVPLRRREPATGRRRQAAAGHRDADRLPRRPGPRRRHRRPTARSSSAAHR